MASYGGFEGILTGLTKSTDHPSTWRLMTLQLQQNAELPKVLNQGIYPKPEVESVYDLRHTWTPKACKIMAQNL